MRFSCCLVVELVLDDSLTTSSPQGLNLILWCIVFHHELLFFDLQNLILWRSTVLFLNFCIISVHTIIFVVFISFESEVLK